jgi:hypothetical protein
MAAVEALTIVKLLANLVGWTPNLDLIGQFLYHFTQTIGPPPRMNIHMPSAYTNIIPAELTHHLYLFPLSFDEALAHLSEPYISVNMPKLQLFHLSHRHGRAWA